MDDGVVSKTKRKQEMTELQTLGAKLVALPDSQLAEIPMDAALREAVLEAKRIRSHEAKRRQMQYPTRRGAARRATGLAASRRPPPPSARRPARPDPPAQRCARGRHPRPPRPAPHTPT